MSQATTLRPMDCVWGFRVEVSVQVEDAVRPSAKDAIVPKYTCMGIRKPYQAHYTLPVADVTRRILGQNQSRTLTRESCNARIAIRMVTFHIIFSCRTIDEIRSRCWCRGGNNEDPSESRSTAVQEGDKRMKCCFFEVSIENGRANDSR